MNDFIELEAESPATLAAVVEAVSRLSAMSEAQILEIVSSGRLKEHFPFRPAAQETDVEDMVDEADLVEASALPLTHGEREKLIQSSMPTRTRVRLPVKTSPSKQRTSKQRASKI